MPPESPEHLICFVEPCMPQLSAIWLHRIVCFPLSRGGKVGGNNCSLFKSSGVSIPFSDHTWFLSTSLIWPPRSAEFFRPIRISNPLIPPPSRYLSVHHSVSLPPWKVLTLFKSPHLHLSSWSWLRPKHTVLLINSVFRYVKYLLVEVPSNTVMCSQCFRLSQTPLPLLSTNSEGLPLSIIIDAVSSVACISYAWADIPSGYLHSGREAGLRAGQLWWPCPQGRGEPVWASLCPGILSTSWCQQTVSAWSLQWERQGLSWCWAWSITLIGNKVPHLFMSLAKGFFSLGYSYLIFSLPLDFSLYFWWFKHYLPIWDGEMAQWWRVLDALVEERVWFPSTRIKAQNHL